MPRSATGGLRRVEKIMGTAISLEIAGDVPADEAVRLADEVYAWMRLVDDTFSTYKDDSEVSRLRNGSLTPAGGSADLRLVLDRCADLWRETDGYFDAYAAGPLDPSGYVKGWSVEVASARLAAAGSARHHINAGGDIRMRGAGPDGRPWRVGIRHPWENGKLSWVLALTDGAVATSGTYERGEHVRNPRTGQPARGLRSVTVTGSDLARADAYATAALAIGEAGIAWLAKLAAEGYESAVVTDDGRAFASAHLPAAV